MIKNLRSYVKESITENNLSPEDFYPEEYEI